MAKRKQNYKMYRYKIQDIKDYLLEYYCLDWRDEYIIRFGTEQKMDERKHACYGNGLYDDTHYHYDFIVYNNNKKQVIWICVSEAYFYVQGYNQPDVSWQEFLERRYGQEQSL